MTDERPKPLPISIALIDELGFACRYSEEARQEALRIADAKFRPLMEALADIAMFDPDGAQATALHALRSASTTK